MGKGRHMSTCSSSDGFTAFSAFITCASGDAPRSRGFCEVPADAARSPDDIIRRL